ncbi:MAG: TolC family protein, partial [Bacteroidaceae bacterium]|nr:TolC family protein [Bacteroidaceae bacterium]
LSISEQIANLYVQILYTREAQRVNEQLTKTAQSQYDRGVEMERQGQISKADLSQLEAQLSSSQYNVVSIETQVSNLKRQLKALLELNLSTHFDVATVIPSDDEVLALLPSAQEAYEKALAVRPEIQSAEKGIDAANLQLDIAKRGYYPTIGVSAALSDSHISGNQRSFGSQMKTNFNASAGVNVSVPIFDNRRNETAVRQAKLRQASSRLDLQDQKNILSSTIEQYWLNARRNQQNFIAARQQLASQQKSYELLNEQFQLGLKNIVQLLTGRDNLINAEQNLLEAKYTTLINMQLLKFYTGEPLEL